MRRRKINGGRITPHGIPLERHEMETILVFTELGYDIELIRPSSTPNAKRADFLMSGLEWEAKCPQGSSRSTLEHVFKKAIRQSENIIIDLRRTQLCDKNALAQLEKLWSSSKKARRLKVITKCKKIIDFKR